MRCSWLCCTLLLVIAGGLVTSNDAELSVPDWPLSWGKLVPPLEGGIRYEFAPPVLAAIGRRRDGWCWRSGRAAAIWRGWPSRTVIAQARAWAVLAVLLVAPQVPGRRSRVPCRRSVFGTGCGAVHSCLRGEYAVDGLADHLQPARSAAAALFAQTILGAAVRHQLVGADAAHRRRGRGDRPGDVGGRLRS